MAEINPNEVYTPQEAQDFLKVSERTMKRWLKNGIIRANKVGGRWRILGREILRAISPQAEEQATGWYRRVKKKTQDVIKHW